MDSVRLCLRGIGLVVDEDDVEVDVEGVFVVNVVFDFGLVVTPFLRRMSLL